MQSQLPPELGLDPDSMMVLLGAAGIVFGLAFLIFLLSRLLVICKPNEIVVISGRKHQLADGSHVGYKVLHGGRGFRIPLLEQVNRMDMRLIPV